MKATRQWGRFLLGIALVLLTSFALADGANSLEVRSLFQPGQTWQITGTDAAGERVRFRIVLDRHAPYHSAANWNFYGTGGMVSYQSQTHLVVASTIDLSDPEVAPVSTRVHACFASVEGQGARGFLVSAKNSRAFFEALKAPSGWPSPSGSLTVVIPKTPNALSQFAHLLHLKVGQCTVTRLR